MSRSSLLDRVYRSILMSEYFVDGWGSAEDIKRILRFKHFFSNREVCKHLIKPDYPVTIKEEKLHNGYRTVNGCFESPFETVFPGLLPKESRLAHFQMILPLKWNSQMYKPVCVHMAGTGDQHFWRRRQIFANPLLVEAGISSILIQNPYYGERKPPTQVRSILRRVTDIFVMGGSLILESIVLFHWCIRNGFGPLGVTGMSMGGHMASLAATNWHQPIVLIPCLSWSTASGVFTEGVMSNAINWDLMEKQFQQNNALRDVMQQIRIIGANGYKNGNVVEDEDEDETCRKQKAAVLFMKGIMDECTHLANFSVPVDTSLIIAVCAKEDGYVPRKGVTDLKEIWPNSEIRYVNAGHVSSFFLYQHAFRKAIIDGFDRYRKKYMASY